MYNLPVCAFISAVNSLHGNAGFQTDTCAREL